MVMDQKFRPFLQKLVRSAHTAVLPEALEEKMMLDLSIQLDQQLESAIEDKLNSEDNSIYSSMVRRGVNPKEINYFLQKKISGLDELIINVIKEFEQNYLEWTSDQK